MFIFLNWFKKGVRKSMTKLKISDLKKHLRNFEQKELIKLVTDLYKLNKEIKQFLAIGVNGEEAFATVFEKAKKEILDEFFPDKGFGKMGHDRAKKAISDFKKNQIITSEWRNVFLQMGRQDFGR